MHKVVSYILVALILAGCCRSVDVRLARVNALAEENLADSATHGRPQPGAVVPHGTPTKHSEERRQYYSA